MNSRILTVLACALVLSVGASYLVYRLVAAGNTRTPASPSRIVVAARDLEIGAVIHESDLKTAPWMGLAPKGSNAEKSGYLRRGIISPIYEGEPVTESRLAAVGSGGGLAATIPTGMRACAVRVNEVVGVAGFVTPGMRVDVLITGVPPGAVAPTGPAVRTLLQNIEVLSAGTKIDKDQEGKPQQAQVVNLLVTPDQAESLSLASNETRIQLILRNPLDTRVTTPPGSVLSELFGRITEPPPVRAPARIALRTPPAAAPPPQVEIPAAPKMRTIEVLNGGLRTQAKFESEGTHP